MNEKELKTKKIVITGEKGGTGKSINQRVDIIRYNDIILQNIIYDLIIINIINKIEIFKETWQM
jgi:hypothetical protein